MTAVQVIPVEGRSDVWEFIDLPWTIYTGYENWVPPLRREIRRLLDPRRHPYWRSAERVLFLARRDGRAVGRIAGIVDHNYNEFHGEKTGSWGFFECMEDQEAASALLGAVEDWLRSKGMTFMRGPMSPSMNYETGILVEGFEHLPAVMMPYNPPYYADLVSSYGLEKECDLLAFHVDRDNRVSERMERLARGIMRRKNLSIVPFSRRNLRSQVMLFKELYNECWADHWAFVPFTDGEAGELLRQFRWIGEEELVFFVYHGDEPAAVALILPDLNPLLKRLDGRLGLTGIIKVLLHRRRLPGLRGLAFGVRKKFRGMGVPLVAYNHLNVTARRKGYQYVEMGWNVENNGSMIQLEREGGAKAYKRYRVYCKSL